LKNEQQQSAYAFKHADIDRLFAAFNFAFEECRALVSQGLPLPAYDQACKASHLFNVLNARGAISVAERAQYIKRIRDLACACADGQKNVVSEVEVLAIGQVSKKRVLDGARPTGAQPVKAVEWSIADLLIEVRCEELPVSMIGPALDGLESGLLALLKGVEHGAVSRFSTPRRLCVVVQSVAGARPVEDRYVYGPKLSGAKTDGAWTNSALSFANKHGVGVEDLVEIDGPKGDRLIAARFSAGGETTPALVAEGLEALILGLPFKKSMRWGSGAARWGRPFHQVIAVYGGERIDTTVAGIPTTDAVIGHRLSTLAPGPVVDAESYLAALRDRHVLADRDQRRAVIREGLAAVAAARGVEVAWNEALIDEVTDLVEWPMPLAATFAEELLHLPPRLLVESMRVNQRVFPTLRDGQLTNVILTVSNNPLGDDALIAEGNKRVLAARFYDAQFFYAEDRKTPLAQHGERLVKMRWVKGLGTMADKQERIGTLAQSLARRVGAKHEAALQAGSLCKSDLLTLMVGEFPELQGHMGRLYAQNDGLDTKVALAIEEHYLPRFAGDKPPKSLIGRAVGLADRLDTLAGCFAIGLVPTGSADPQGLRRAANGVLAILVAAGWRVNLSTLIDMGLDQFFPKHGIDQFLLLSKYDCASFLPDPSAVAARLLQFILERLRAQLKDEGFATELVDAVLGAGGDDVLNLRARVDALATLARTGGFGELVQLVKRVQNISKDHDSAEFDAAALPEPAERALAEAFKAVRDEVNQPSMRKNVGAALARMIELRPAVALFFDQVLVMAEDEALRRNRLGLLRAVAELFRSVADFRNLSAE
jgi:glycyl-tRNA synthetase beta chain